MAHTLQQIILQSPEQGKTRTFGTATRGTSPADQLIRPRGMPGLHQHPAKIRAVQAMFQTGPGNAKFPPGPDAFTPGRGPDPESGASTESVALG